MSQCQNQCHTHPKDWISWTDRPSRPSLLYIYRWYIIHYSKLRTYSLRTTAEYPYLALNLVLVKSENAGLSVLAKWTWKPRNCKFLATLYNLKLRNQKTNKYIVAVLTRWIDASHNTMLGSCVLTSHAVSDSPKFDPRLCWELDFDVVLVVCIDFHSRNLFSNAFAVECLWILCMSYDWRRYRRFCFHAARAA